MLHFQILLGYWRQKSNCKVYKLKTWSIKLIREHWRQSSANTDPLETKRWLSSRWYKLTKKKTFDPNSLLVFTRIEYLFCYCFLYIMGGILNILQNTENSWKLSLYWKFTLTCIRTILNFCPKTYNRNALIKR